MFSCCLVALFSLPVFAQSQTEAGFKFFEAKKHKLSFDQELARQEKSIEEVLKKLESSLSQKNLSLKTDRELNVE